MKFLFTLSTVLAFSFSGFAAKSGRIAHQYIAEFQSGRKAEEWQRMQNDVYLERLGEGVLFYLVIFTEKTARAEEENLLRMSPEIVSFSENRLVEARGCKPNDPKFGEQWNLSFMGFEEAWCYNHDGITPSGDTIAIGLIDFGFDYRSADLTENLFRNRQEIPANNLDDDNNGYVDDYLGFNARSGFGDSHDTTENHGTNVLSLIQAKGNNSYQISGTNQTVKVVLCSARDDASLIRSYSYFLKMRNNYISSGGQKGAYIVATSISLGYEDMPSDHPALCEMYDLLGKAGIINVCATINEEENIDTYGDVPSLCPSEYLISVTNTDRNDIKAIAGYSKNNVDIAASGEEVLVIGRRGELQVQSGCSLSAPQVAGGIAYLNQFCESYTTLSKNKPAEAALLMKSFVFNGSKSLLSLRELTATGKRFDVFGAMIEIINYCGQTLFDNQDIIVKTNPVMGDELNLELHLTQFGNYTIEIYNIEGQIIVSKNGSLQPGGSINQTIDTHTLTAGMYRVAVRRDKSLISRAFLKL